MWLGIVIILACLPAIILGIGKTEKRWRAIQEGKKFWRIRHHVARSEDIWED